MKLITKLKLLTVSVVFSTMLHASEHKYTVLTDDLTFVKGIPFNYGTFQVIWKPAKSSCLDMNFYDGWVNKNNQPMGYGILRDKKEKGGSDCWGEFRNGKLSGAAYARAYSNSSRYTYIGFVSNFLPNNYGNLTEKNAWTETEMGTVWSKGTINDGLCLSSEYDVIIQSGEVKQRADEEYKALLYNDKKSKIKAKVEAAGYKYVEDMTINDDIHYSGGWKEGCPIYYGAICREGYAGIWYEYGYIINYSKEGGITFGNEYTVWRRTRNKPSFFADRFANNEGDTIYVRKSIDSYVYKVFDKTGNAKEICLADGQKRQYAYSIDNDANGMWGFVVDLKEGTLYEGYINHAGIPIGEKRLITKDGEFHKGNVTTFPNKCKFIQSTIKGEELIFGYYVFGELVFENGDYAIGYFKPGWNSNYPTYPNTLEPIAVREFFSDGEQKNDILYEYRERKNGELSEAHWLDKIVEYMDVRNAPEKGEGTYTYTNGNQYTGTWLNHVPQGFGTMKYSNGTSFTGMWELGTPKGKGKISMPNGDFYDGEFVDTICVNGVARYSSSIGVYEGEWKEGKANGLGKMSMPNGDFFEGEFVDTICVNGVARYSSSVGVYEGEWKEGNANGQGKLSYINGDIFVGNFAQGHPFMDGTLTLVSGESIKSKWDRCKMISDTLILQSNGLTYYGEIINGKLVGHAKVIYMDGSVYEGEWQEGKHGNGVEKYGNGDKIIAQWHQNSIDEKNPITYIWSDGRKFVGLLKKGILSKGDFLYTDGTKAPKKVYKNWLVQPIKTDVIHMPHSEHIQ